jgi:hypothetical protein
MRKQLLTTLLRMALQLFSVTIVAGLARVVLGGEVTFTAAIAFVIAVVLVVALLTTAYRLTKK